MPRRKKPNHPSLPCHSQDLMQWLHDIQCMCEKSLDEWSSIIHASRKDREMMTTRYGDLNRVVPFPTFVIFWICRDLPIAKKPDGISTNGNGLAPVPGRTMCYSQDEREAGYVTPPIVRKMQKTKVLPGWEEIDTKAVEDLQNCS